MKEEASDFRAQELYEQVKRWAWDPCLSPSLINQTVSVDIKQDEKRLRVRLQRHRRICAKIVVDVPVLMVSVDVKRH